MGQPRVVGHVDACRPPGRSAAWPARSTPAPGSTAPAFTPSRSASSRALPHSSNDHVVQRSVFLLGKDPDFALSIRFNHGSILDSVRSANCVPDSLRRINPTCGPPPIRGSTAATPSSVARISRVSLLGQHDRLHAEDLGGRAGQAAPRQGRRGCRPGSTARSAGPAACRAADAALDLGGLLGLGGLGQVVLHFAGHFGGDPGPLAPHHPLGRRRTRLVGRLASPSPAPAAWPRRSPSRGPCCGGCAPSPPADPSDLLQVGDLRDAQLLGALRPDLGRVAVDGLPAAEDEIVAADGADRLAEDVAGGQGVAGGGAAIGQQDHPIGPSEEAVAEHVGRLGRAHA